MFNSSILDVAIGMIFVYILLSLMCSAANEIIELLLKKRAIDLKRGIRELLAPNSPSGQEDVVQNLYNHPLVNSLFGGLYEDSRIGHWFTRKFMRTGLPSYIPARTFALALMDLVLPGVNTETTVGNGTVSPSGTAGATPPPANFDVNLTALPAPPPPVASDGNPLTRLRNAIGTNEILTDHARKALTSLVDAAGTDKAKVRENIENWFNTSMDRVSSWYKRRTQVVIFILGAFLAVTANADSIALVKRLSTDKALRDSLVAASLEYAKEQNNANANTNANTNANSNANANANTNANANGNTSTNADTGALPACVKNPKSEECRRAKALLACETTDSPECRFLRNEKRLSELGLPIGWENQGETWPGWSRREPGLSLRNWGNALWAHGLGWLLTAFAISLGAPFWFDLLNKFIVIRSAVKPHEKSPEEESKD